MNYLISTAQAAELLDIPESMAIQLIKAGVIRSGGFNTTSGAIAYEIPSHEVSRLNRVGFIPFTERAHDPQTFNDSHTTYLSHLIEAATQTQAARRHMKALRATEVLDPTKLKPIDDLDRANLARQAAIDTIMRIADPKERYRALVEHQQAVVAAERAELDKQNKPDTKQ